MNTDMSPILLTTLSRMKLKPLAYSACLLLLLALPSYAGSLTYSLTRIQISSQADWENLKKTGLALEEGIRINQKSVELVLSDQELKKLQQNHFHVVVLERDVSRKIASNLATGESNGFATGSMSGYFTFDEVISKVRQYQNTFPKLVGPLKQIGTSIEGRPIYAFKISDNPEQEEADEPEVLYISLQHAREPAGMMTLLYFIEQLLKAYQPQNMEATFVVNHRQLWFIPVANPDGYVYNQQNNPNGGGLWRKNRRNNGQSYGVDLNRNFSFAWAYDNSGSSSNPQDETYRGSAPFSEPEDLALRGFVARHNFRISLNYHSYLGALIYPWAYTNGLTPDRQTYFQQSTRLVTVNEYVTGNTDGTLGYTSNGDSDDWLYGDRAFKPKVIAYTCELGSDFDGFWPSINRVMQIVRKNYSLALWLAEMADSHVAVEDFYESSKQGKELPKGHKSDVSIILRNSGLQIATNLFITLKSKNPGIIIDNPSSPPSTLKSLGRAVKHFKVTVPATTTSENANIEVEISINGIFLRKELLRFFLY
jgi:murein tripeptide amidase MpaA